jgi:hypothetical protein
MANPTQAQKDSQAVSQHQRIAMGAKLDGKTLPGSVPKTPQIPK